MLHFYHLQGGRLARTEGAPASSSPVAWIDLVHPTDEEEDQVEAMLGIEIPTREEMSEIEISSRLYRDREAIYMTASLLTGSEGPDPKTSPVTFILTHTHLITVRYSEPGAFRIFIKQGQAPDPALKPSDSIFVALLEAVIDRTADILEKVGAEMDSISRGVFQAEMNAEVSRDYKTVLRRIGRNGDLNSKVRESLVSLGRLVNYASGECGTEHPGLREHTDTMAADIRSITDHASYLAGSTAFVLDATLGMIGIEQNAIIKIVSVVSVLIMPPTLIASIYGMNFRYMPELDWRIGYPLALLAMVVAAVIPYWYFRRRGWL